MMDTIKSEKKERERVRPDYSGFRVTYDLSESVRLTGYTPEEIVDKVHCTPESKFRIGKNQVVPVAYRYNWVFKGLAHKHQKEWTSEGGEWKEFNKNHSPILESGQSIKQEAIEYKCKECDTPLAEQNKGYNYMCHDCWMNSAEVRYDNISLEQDEGGPIND